MIILYQYWWNRIYSRRWVAVFSLTPYYRNRSCLLWSRPHVLCVRLLRFSLSRLLKNQSCIKLEPFFYYLGYTTWNLHCNSFFCHPLQYLLIQPYIKQINSFPNNLNLPTLIVFALVWFKTDFSLIVVWQGVGRGICRSPQIWLKQPAEVHAPLFRTSVHPCVQSRCSIQDSCSGTWTRLP